MDHGKFAPKCPELWNLISKNAGTDLVSGFLNQDPGLIEYLQQNEIFDEKDFSGWRNYNPPLHRAACLGRVDVLQLLLLKYNFNKDSRWVFGGYSWTPIHYAIVGYKHDCVKLLLEQGANPLLGGKSNGEDFENSLDFANRFRGRQQIKKTLRDTIEGEARNGKPY